MDRGGGIKMPKKKENKLDQILCKLDEHDDKFGQIFNKLNGHDQAFAKIADKLIEHDQRFDQMNVKIDVKFNDVLGGLDKVMGELEDAREDRVLAKGKDKDQDQRLDKIEIAVGIKSN